MPNGCAILSYLFCNLSKIVTNMNFSFKDTELVLGFKIYVIYTCTYSYEIVAFSWISKRLT